MVTEPATRLAIREARPADYEAIRQIARQANAEFRAPMGETLFEAYLTNNLDVEGRVAVGTVFVATDGDRVVGTITHYADVHDEGMPVRFPDGTAGLRSTAVALDARGHGIGGLLVGAVVERARAQGQRRVALHTATCMAAAMRLYERNGFRREPDHDYVANDFFSGGAGDQLIAIAFVLDLRA